MTVILQDPVLARDPAARHAFPDPAARTKAWSALEHAFTQGDVATFTPGATVDQVTFEVGSHGGYARTVTGRIAYFDEQAQTYLVVEPAGTMARVPTRDIISSRGAAIDGLDPPTRSEDGEGLGTGQDGTTTRSSRGWEMR